MTVIPGYVVHRTLTYGRGYSADEQTRMFDHFNRLRADSHLFMDHIDFAREAKRRWPDCIVVYRHYLKEDGSLYKVMTPAEFVKLHKPFAAGGIVVQCLNEPSGYGSVAELVQLAKWCADVMRLASDSETVLALPNFGVGHPNENQLSALNDLWEAFKDYPEHFYACHEYGTYRGMLHTDETHRRDVTPWRVGRFKFVTAYVKQNFNIDLNILITETGIDSSQYADDDKQKRGWRDSGLNEVQYALEIIKAAKTVYNVPNIKGLHIFSHGNTGKEHSADDWKSHDVSFLADFQRELETYSASQKDDDMSFPLSTDPKWKQETNLSGKKFDVLKTLTAPAPAASILPGETFWSYPGLGEQNAIIVKALNGQVGYCDKGVLVVVPPKPDPLPIPPDDPDEPDTTPTGPGEEELLLIELRRAWQSVGEACNKLAIASARYADYLKSKEDKLRNERLNAA